MIRTKSTYYIYILVHEKTKCINTNTLKRIQKSVKTKRFFCPAKPNLSPPSRSQTQRCYSTPAFDRCSRLLDMHSGLQYPSRQG